VVQTTPLAHYSQKKFPDPRYVEDDIYPGTPHLFSLLQHPTRSPLPGYSGLVGIPRFFSHKQPVERPALRFPLVICFLVRVDGYERFSGVVESFRFPLGRFFFSVRRS